MKYEPGKFFKSYGIWLLLLAAALAGLAVLRDYGISWDEPEHYNYGLVNSAYVFGGDRALLDSGMKAYGVAFEWLCLGVVKLLRLSDIRDILYARHLITHLFFLFSALFLYRTVLLVWEEEWLGLTAALFYILSPAVYAHSFFNPKDLPFLSMFVICTYLAVRALSAGTWRDWAVLGAASGLLMNIRVTGAVLPALAAAFALPELLAGKERARALLPRLAAALAAGAAALYLTWPYLWAAPLPRLAEAFRGMAHFPWPGGVLFGGKMISARELPWSYAPVWLAITTPPAYLLLAAAGAGLLLPGFFRGNTDPAAARRRFFSLFFLACFALPFLLVAALHSVLYDGWRQLFFVYGSFLLLAASALHRLAGLLPGRRKAWLFVLIGLVCAGTLREMAVLHPFENVYFNDLVRGLKRGSEGLRMNYELDYWGTSFKQGLEYILKTDARPRIKLFTNIVPSVFALYALPKEDRRRLVMIDARYETPDYYLSNYRWSPALTMNYPEVFSITRYNSRILSVWKVEGKGGAAPGK